LRQFGSIILGNQLEQARRVVPMLLYVPGIDWGVDLHRILSQKGPFLASKTDPSAAPWIFEKLLFALLGTGHFQVAKVGSIQRANQQSDDGICRVRIAFCISMRKAASTSLVIDI